MIALLLALFILIPSLVQATTRYVAVTGSDAAAGTQAAPYRNIQKCIDVSVAGDTCLIGDGTYTDNSLHAGTVGYIFTNAQHGNSTNPITLKSLNYLGATVQLPSINSRNAGFLVGRNYWIIEGFNITGGTSTGTGASHHGVYVTTGSDGLIVRKNTIHDIGRVCSASGSGFTGTYIDGGTGITYEKNLIYNIGRYRFNPSENGCALSAGGGGQQQNDHGMYFHGATNVTIKNNVIYNATMGFPIQLFGATMTNTLIYNNTISGEAAVITNVNPIGQIMIASTVTTLAIKNNIFNTTTNPPFNTFSLTCTAITYDYNLTPNADADNFNGSKPSCATDGGHNIESTSPGFVSSGTNDYTLTSASAAIDAGVNVGLAFNSTAPDIGAFETFKCNASATINANLLDTTCAMNLNTPVLPNTGITGMVALVGGVARGTTTSAVLAGTDSVVRTTFDGATCVLGEVWTNTYTAGNLTDSALIGGSLNQKALTSTALSVTNACSSSGSPTFTQVASSSFNSDENPISEGGVWTVTNGGAGSMKILTARITPTDFGQNSTAKYTGSAFSADQYATADITTVSTAGSGVGMGLCVRCATAADTKISFHIDHAASNNAELAEFVGGVYHFLDHWTQTFTNADTFTLAVSGQSIYVYDKTGTLVRGPITATGSVPSSGSAGVSFSGSTSSGTFADNWKGGNFSLTPLACTLSQVAHQFYQAFTVGGVAVANGSLSGNITLTRPNLSFAIGVQLDDTIAACNSVGLNIRYSLNGGAFTAVPDTLGADQIAFFGNTGDPTVLQGSVTCCLSGVLTHNTGSTQLTAAATPVVTMAQDSSIVLQYVMTIGATATPTNTYDFKVYDQSGNALPSYTPSGGGRVTVGSTTLSVPGSFHQTGTASNTIVSLVWAPVTDANFAGYNIYQSTTSGVYSTTPTARITTTTAAATHSSMTQWTTVLPVAGTYYFTVRSVDTGGNVSAASSEVAVTVTGFSTRSTAVPQ